MSYKKTDLSLDQSISLVLYSLKLVFTSQLSYLKLFPNLNQLGINHYRKKVYLKIRCSSTSFIEKIIIKKVCSSMVCIDENSTVLVNPSILIKLNITNGAWVPVQFQNRNNPPRERWTRIYRCDGMEDGTCLVSPIMLSNCTVSANTCVMVISNSTSSTLQNTLDKFYYLGVQPISMHVSLSHPCTATSVSLSVVEHQDYQTDINLDESLQQYFESPKLVCIKDILAIPSLSITSAVINKPTRVYVKVFDIQCSRSCPKGNCHLVHLGKSKCVLVGTCTSSNIPHQDSLIDNNGSICIPPHISKTYHCIRSIISSQLVNWNIDLDPPFNNKSSTSRHNTETLARVVNVDNGSSANVLHSSSHNRPNCGHVLLLGNTTEVSLKLLMNTTNRNCYLIIFLYNKYFA